MSPPAPQMVFTPPPQLFSTVVAAARPDPVWVVGGFVRDHFLGRQSHDLDLVMAAGSVTIDRAARRINDSVGGRVLWLGSSAHRIARIISAATQIELWGLHGTTLENDLSRRDFTINALAWRLPDGPLVDPVGGLDDLRRTRLVAVSANNLAEDPLRVLRGVRLLSELEDMELVPSTRRMLMQYADSVASVAMERVGAELLRIVRAPAAHRAMSLLLELNLVRSLAPEGSTYDQRRAQQLPPTALRLSRCPGAPSAQALLAALLRAWGNPAERNLTAYAWPRELVRSASTIAVEIDGITTLSEPAERREVIARLGPATPAALRLATAIEPRFALETWLELWNKHGTELTTMQPILTSEEICSVLGIPPGPDLGAAIRQLLRAQIRGEVDSVASARRFLRAARDEEG